MLVYHLLQNLVMLGNTYENFRFPTFYKSTFCCSISTVGISKMLDLNLIMKLMNYICQSIVFLFVVNINDFESIFVVFFKKTCLIFI
jgi:hypothetical protein